VVKRSVAILGVAASVFGVASCELTGLGNLPAGHCSSHMDCEPLNTHAAIDPSATARWQCDTQSHCVFRACRDDDNDGAPDPRCATPPALPDCDDSNPNRTPGRMETCDGVDNNCDGIVDEGVFASAPQATPTMLGDTARVEPSQSSSRMIEFVTASSSGIGFLPGTTGPTSVALGSVGASSGVSSPLMDTTVSTSCPATTGPCALDDARLVDLHPQSGGAAQILVALSMGRVIPFLWDPGGPNADKALAAAPAVRSSVAYGIDVDESGGVVVPNQTGTASGRMPAGASAIATASLDPTSAIDAEALVAWIGAPAGTGRCAAPSAVPVVASALQLDSAEAPGRLPRWLSASNSGRETRLGSTGAWTGPVVLAIQESNGFVVLWPGAMAGQLEAASIGSTTIVPTQAPSAALAACCATANCTLPGPLTTCLNHPRSSPDLRVTPMTAVTLGTMPVTGIAAALGSRDANGRDVGVAWIDGCADSGGPLRFAHLRVAADLSSIAIIGNAMLAPTATRAAIVDVATNVLVAGSTRGTMTVPPTRTGGWLVASLEPIADGRLRAVARRVSELDDTVVDVQAVQLDGDMHAPTARDVVLAGGDVGGPSFVVQRPMGVLMAGSLSCPNSR
jgi:hypothetical protein